MPALARQAKEDSASEYYWCSRQHYFLLLLGHQSQTPFGPGMGSRFSVAPTFCLIIAVSSPSGKSDHHVTAPDLLLLT